MKAAHTQIVEQARHYGLSLMSNMNQPPQNSGPPQQHYNQQQGGYGNPQMGGNGNPQMGGGY